MGRFRERQRLRQKYEESADALREEFMRSRGYTPEEELDSHLIHLRDRALMIHGREPSDVEIAEISDMLNRLGVLPLPPDVHTALGKTESETIRQSDIEKLLRGGKRLNLGDTKIDLARGVSAPSNAGGKEISRASEGARVLIPGIIFREIATAGASRVGVPR